MRKEPRLHFTDEERADPALEKPIRKADRAAAKADKAQAKIPKKQVRQKAVDPKTGKVTTKLVLEDKKKPPSKLSHAVRDAPGDAALGKLHKEIREMEQDNVGVESAHKSEEAVETGVRLFREGYRSHKLKPYRKAAQAEQKLENSYTVEVPYNYYILNVTLTSKPISSVATELLTPDQLEMYQVYRQTLGNKPLIFGGGSTNTSDSESLEGVEFINGTRPGNSELVELAKRQVGNVGGQPYWSWYGFNSRVEWCACFVSWCYGQMGLSEPRFAGCQSQGVPWFQSHGQWGARGYDNLAPGDAIFFDWDLDGSADHVGIVIGTDGSRVYTVEGNSGDACKIRSYDVNYECIKGYGLMNW